MRFVPTILALFLLAILAMCVTGCTSVTYHDKGGATLHVGAFFGDAKVASVEAAGVRVTGFEARNADATKKYLNAWTWGKLIPVAGDAINSTENIINTAIKR